MGDYEDSQVVVKPGGEGELSAASDKVKSLLGPLVENEQIADLHRWLNEFWDTQMPETLRKAHAYGSADLALIGASMLMVLPEESRHLNGERLGISFYLQGKIARVFGAIEHGSTPTEDTFYDIAIYAIMALRCLQEGSWLR